MDTLEGKQLLDAANKNFLASGGDKEPVKQEKVTIKFAFSSVAIVENIKKMKFLIKKIFFQYAQTLVSLNQKTIKAY